MADDLEAVRGQWISGTDGGRTRPLEPDGCVGADGARVRPLEADGYLEVDGCRSRRTGTIGRFAAGGGYL